MEVHLDSEEAAMAQRDRKGKRRPQGRTATPPAEVAARTGQILTEREAEWLDRLARDPASFAAVEREVHDQARHQADLYVAGLLAKPGCPRRGNWLTKRPYSPGAILHPWVSF
jgi:hypothetical protein